MFVLLCSKKERMNDILKERVTLMKKALLSLALLVSATCSAREFELHDAAGNVIAAVDTVDYYVDGAVRGTVTVTESEDGKIVITCSACSLSNPDDVTSETQTVTEGESAEFKCPCSGGGLTIKPKPKA